MLARRLIATAAIAAGLGVGVASTAQAAPAPASNHGTAITDQSGGTVHPDYWFENKGWYDSEAACKVAGATDVFFGLADWYECAPNNGWTKFFLRIYGND